ncbi:hypothetical protein BDZ89DRAFT_1053070 [Hymenopellis radicata]|nr:hypothetical protein BDZ89DRAFT_1053070 [Hymenopellis radicata]
METTGEPSDILSRIWFTSLATAWSRFCGYTRCSASSAVDAQVYTFLNGAVTWSSGDQQLGVPPLRLSGADVAVTLGVPRGAQSELATYNVRMTQRFALPLVTGLASRASLDVHGRVDIVLASPKPCQVTPRLCQRQRPLLNEDLVRHSLILLQQSGSGRLFWHLLSRDLVYSDSAFEDSDSQRGKSTLAATTVIVAAWMEIEGNRLNEIGSTEDDVWREESWGDPRCWMAGSFRGRRLTILQDANLSPGGPVTDCGDTRAEEETVSVVIGFDVGVDVEKKWHREFGPAQSREGGYSIVHATVKYERIGMLNRSQNLGANANPCPSEGPLARLFWTASTRGF